MQMLTKHKTEFARALRNHAYERTQNGLLFVRQKTRIGGLIACRVNNGPLEVSNNTMSQEFLDALLTAFFAAGSVPAGLYIAPFTNNVAPSDTLTAATFAATQGEYTGYTQGSRVQWVANGASEGQTVSNSNAPAAFTIGASAATIAGAGVLSVSTKSATTGVLVAAALFGTPNTLNPGSTLSVQYNLSATPE